MKNSPALGANDEYEQQTTLYGRKDALFALVISVIVSSLFLLLGKIFILKGSTLTVTYTFFATGIVSLSCIGLVFLFCYIQKQDLATVGFSRKQAKESFVLGIVLFVIALVLRSLGEISSGLSYQPENGPVIMRIIYNLFFVALMEEILIRGYIGTRLYGYFKNKGLSMVLVGIIWSLYHIPFHMIITQMSLLEYISANGGYLFRVFIYHFIFQWLYSKNNSLIAPTILHFIIDFR